MISDGRWTRFAPATASNSMADSMPARSIRSPASCATSTVTTDTRRRPRAYASGPLPALLCFHFANAVRELFWNLNHVESVQITMANSFGVHRRGAFYDETGAVRDVVQNHLFQVLSNLAMEPPVRTDSESIRDEK